MRAPPRRTPRRPAWPPGTPPPGSPPGWTARAAGWTRRTPGHRSAPRPGRRRRRDPGSSASTVAPSRRSTSTRSAACGDRTTTALRAEVFTKSSIGSAGDQPAAADDDELVGHQRHLGEQVAGDEHRPAGGREALEQLADPLDALRVEPVRGLVEDQRVRVAEQRGGEPEPLPHAEGERAGLLPRDGGQPELLEHLVDAAGRDAVGRREHPQVVAGLAGRVERLGLEQRPDLGHGAGQGGERARRRRSSCPGRGRGRASAAWSWTCRRRWARGTR